MKRAFLGSAAVAALLLLGGCGDDNGGNNTPPSGVTLTPSGPPLSDEEYLRVFCTGITNFRDALNTEDRDGLIEVIQDYIDSMRVVNPPEDAQGFHASFIGYLQEALEEPTQLITRNPPRPPDDVRSRLADKTSDVEECRYPTFLDGQ